MIWSGGTCHRWRRTCQHTLTSVATSSSETLVPMSSIFHCDQPTWSHEKAQRYDDGDRRCPEHRSCPRKYRSPSDRDHSADFTEQADEPCNSLAAFATGSSFSPSRIPFRMSFRIPRSSPAASKPSNARTAKKLGVRRTMLSLSSEPVP